MSRILRTSATGVVATIVDLVALVGFVDGLGVPTGLAAFLASSVGAVVGYFVAKRWAFRDASAVRWTQMARYAAVALVSALLTGITVGTLAGRFGWSYVLAKICAATLIFLAWSYPAQRFVVFRRFRRAVPNINPAV